MIASIFLQAAPDAVTTVTQVHMNIFTLLMKGGWIMAPLLLLFGIMIFVTGDAGFALRRLAHVDQGWLSKLLDLVRGGQYEKAYAVAREDQSALARVLRAGIRANDLPREQAEEDMQVEVRGLLSKVESQVGYLSLIAAIAPMLGFLGTIFGVINIFIKISLTNDLSIASISDGLYQKMICSGTGLMVGILAYCAYYLLNRRVDKMVAILDRGCNQFIKAMCHPTAK